jgi:hypothetical protein
MDRSEIFRQLRTKLDGSDPFVSGGHRIIKIRTATPRVIPDWTRNDKEVRKVLLRSFPKLNEDPIHRSQAARWTRVLHLYFRMGLTRGQISKEMKLSASQVNSFILTLKRVGAGHRADGKGLLGAKPRGNPNWAPNPTKPKRTRKFSKVGQLERYLGYSLTKKLWKKLDFDMLTALCTRNLIRSLSIHLRPRASIRQTNLSRRATAVQTTFENSPNGVTPERAISFDPPLKAGIFSAFEVL